MVELFLLTRKQQKTKEPKVFSVRSPKDFTDGALYNGIVLLLPLIVTPLEEYTVVAAANYATKDAKKGNTIVSSTH